MPSHLVDGNNHRDSSMWYFNDSSLAFFRGGLRKDVVMLMQRVAFNFYRDRNLSLVGIFWMHPAWNIHMKAWAPDDSDSNEHMWFLAIKDIKRLVKMATLKYIVDVHANINSIMNHALLN